MVLHVALVHLFLLLINSPFIILLKVNFHLRVKALLIFFPQQLIVRNSSAVDNLVLVSWRSAAGRVFLGNVPGNRIAGPWAVCVFTF